MSTDPCGHTAGKDAPPLADRRPQPEAQMFTLKTSQTMKSKPLLSRSAPATLSLNRLWSLVAISLLAGWGFPQLGQASTPDGARSTSTTALQASPDFVHDECVFDSCYTFFVRLNDRVGRTRYGATFMAHTVWMNPSAVYFGQRDNVSTLQRIAREFQTYQQSVLSSGRYDETAEKASSSASSPPSATPPRPCPTSMLPSTASMAATYPPTSTPSSRTPPSPTPSA